MFLELGVDQRANRGSGDVGIRDSDRRVQILEDISQSLVFNNIEGLIRIDYPFDQKALEVASVKSTYDRVGNRLFPRPRRIELQCIHNRSQSLAPWFLLGLLLHP